MTPGALESMRRSRLAVMSDPSAETWTGIDRVRTSIVEATLISGGTGRGSSICRCVSRVR